MNRRRKSTPERARPRGRRAALSRLRPEEAEAVLRLLLERRADLRADAEQIARSLLERPSLEAIAQDVECAVTWIEDFRAGPDEVGGYTNPGEGAAEAIEDAVVPWIEDMRRAVELGLERQALEICLGIVLGLYRARDTEDGALAWAPDSPEELAATVVETWYAGDDPSRPPSKRRKRPRHRATFPDDFLERHVPEWVSRLRKAASGGGS